MSVLGKKFFERDTVSVARELLGKKLVYGACSGLVVETEAYLGETDLASHASSKSRKRSFVMFGPPGHVYVYFTYGNHWMFNVVTEKKGTAGAVLIRALQPLEGISLMQKRRKTSDLFNLCSGPAKLCQAFGITGRLNGSVLSRKTIHFVDQKSTPEIACSPRVGISKGSGHLFRFYVKDSWFVSRILRKA